jgi:hypothetical protein
MILTTRRLATAILFIGLFAMATRVSVDSDSFWHLRAGTWMLDNGRLLNFDAFSHTRFNTPWINHSWLSEVFMAVIYRIAGFAGLNLAISVVVCLAFLFVYQSGRGGVYLRAFVIVIAATTSAVYWSARPQIVSMLLAAVFGYILIEYRQRSINRLWLLPLLMVLWVNLHGGFAIGFILLVITFGGEVLKWLVNLNDVDARSRVLWLGAAGLLCAAAVNVNPYGIQMLAYPFRTVSIGALQNYIQEWQSPNFHEREAQVFIALWLAALAAVSYSGKRLDPTDFFLFATFTALALVARRNIAVFAIVAAPIVMTHADAALAALQDRWPSIKLNDAPRPLRPVTVILNWTLLLLVVAASLLKISLPLSPITVQTAIAATAPVGAADYLKAHPFPGRLFNSYNNGGYLIWALYPDTLVFMDGRTDLYDDEFLTTSLNVFFTGVGWQELFARYNVGVVLVEANAPIVKTLLKQPDWAVRYRDQHSVVIVKLNE